MKSSFSNTPIATHRGATTKAGVLTIVAILIGFCTLGFFCLVFGAFGQFFSFSSGLATISGDNTALLTGKAYFLIVGLDDAAAGGADRTDMIGVLGIDFDQSKSVFLSIPRDLMVDESTASATVSADATTANTPTKKLVKINSIYKKSGIEVLQKKLEVLFGIQFDKYAIINYEVFRLLGDRLGPVKVNVRTTLEYEDTVQNLKIHFAPGIHELYGNDLLLYIRFRNDPLGDLGRIQRQKEVMISLFQSLKQKKDLNLMTSIIQEILKKMTTNIQPMDALGLWQHSGSLESLRFLNFPYSINATGELEIEPTKFPRTVQELNTLESIPEPYTPQIVLINGWNDNAYQFSITEYNAWNAQSFRPFIIDQKFSHNAIKKWGKGNDLLLYLVKESEKQKVILAMYQKTYPGTSPTTLYPQIGVAFDDYLSMLNSIFKAGSGFSFPCDAIIIKAIK